MYTKEEEENMKFYEKVGDELEKGEIKRAQERLDCTIRQLEKMEVGSRWWKKDKRRSLLEGFVVPISLASMAICFPPLVIGFYNTGIPYRIKYRLMKRFERGDEITLKEKEDLINLYRRHERWNFHFGG